MLNGKLIASRVSGHPIAAQNELFYLLTDHLGSVVQTVKDDGTAVGNVIRYNPFGGYRAAPTSEQDDVSDRGYTGHYDNDDLGLVYMNARYYLPNTNRFISADTIVPDPTNPQSLNRYTYVYNNPLRFTDPSGHGICNPADNCRNQTPSRTLPNNKPDGLKEDGKNAWNGLQSIQDYHDAWWDTDLNPTEAMVIALQEEFGYGNRLGQRTTDALANRFNAFCGGGVWSGDCVQAFWGYMQPIREPDWADMLEHPIYSNPEAMSGLSRLANEILQGTYQSETDMFHWANIYDDEIATVAYEEWKNGDRRHMEWAVAIYEGDMIVNVFALQTSAQHAVTGSFADWRQ